MIDKALNFIQDHIPDNWLKGIWAFFTTLTVVDILSIGWKCVTGSITLFFFYLAWLRHKDARELNRIRKAIEEQELYDKIQSNKKKHG